MTGLTFNSWQAIQDEVMRRIHARVWPPGTVIPNEADLALEFGCARATVNRALRALAEMGILERRRKAGTRVALHPVSRATLDIPVIRQEITERGQSYGYQRLSCAILRPPAEIARTLWINPASDALHVSALHLSETRPFVIEDRWINLTTAPAAAAQDFETLSANEWLVVTIPYTHGSIRFTAAAATAQEAELLCTTPGAPVFVVERLTWDHERTVTLARLCYGPGYSITTGIGTPS
ncbi:MAG: GntR family transcriptional regulator [Rhodobacteraceae bacterium CG17_big_fil_post_rev_8_21_14_2_50_63_15]|nr:UTRA domain-containing protein [Roseovarius sp.]PIV78058.1 MAG: GntR family transcriptional regulator [Rhodobacteraceae bacterium CG17_big_fil_post_rev_8_21_14_2_50_63_15]